MCGADLSHLEEEEIEAEKDARPKKSAPEREGSRK
jgi:hypothetical protein